MVESALEERTWLVAVDGSKASKDAFFVALEDFYVDKKDKIIVVSVTDMMKTSLPYEYQPSTIANDYKIELLSKLHPSHYSIILAEKKEGKNVHETILQQAEEKNATAIFIGYHGRKGPKLDPSIMGQTVRYSTNNATRPIVIVKFPYFRAKARSGVFTYMICLDGSSKSFKVLEALHTFSKPGDKFVAVTVQSTPDEETIEKIAAHIKKFEERAKMRIDYLTLKAEDAETIHGPVVDFVNRNEDYKVDFVMFSSWGLKTEVGKLAALTIGSFATKLISFVQANLIMIP
eukprot:CAMPEP_0176442692 /NCGR_PEP_ID=MMETSP0127-20121128/21976_1 /TAXON_ID=938130 /ORGANISM="Platyophrya macrostoma, Strain WH" /LENGTH=288 /DNA_ID=CAMNT_0017827773 /DNA_START=41 /DNA_END=907 /DNA_ORIENTATION=+